MGCSPLVQQERTHGSQQMAAIPTVASVRPISSVPRDCWPEATLAPCLVGLSIQSLPYKHHLCPQGQLKRTPALRCPLYNPSWWVKHGDNGDTSTKGLVTFYPQTGEDRDKHRYQTTLSFLYSPGPKPVE